MIINTHYYACCSNQQPAGDWFYFEDATGAANTLSLVKSNTSAPTVTLEYSYDGNTWTTWGTTSTTALTLNIPANSKVYLRGTNTKFGAVHTNADNYNKFSSTGNVSCGGVISSMLTNTKEPLLDLTGRTYAYYGMFYGMTKLLNAPELPATTLDENCYNMMFNGCTSLTTAPEFPATTLAPYCYDSMFCNCTSLTIAPTLQATTLATYCCQGMFRDCTSLTTAPELPAITLADGCYSNMFNGCTSLTSAPSLPATTLAISCYGSMFIRCTSLTSAPELPATTLAHGCYSYMFSGCTSMTTAPSLPATALANNCYGSMFYGCTSLTTVPELQATTLAEGCYNGMFYGCESLKSAPSLPVTTLANSCYSSMFYGCTSLTTAPELPATTLAISCYESMFNGCTNLNEIHCNALDISATSCLNNWVNGVASSGTFYRNENNEDWESGKSGIPTGWTIIPPMEFKEKYFYFENASGIANTLSLVKNGTSAPDVTLQYSYDGNTWTTWGTTSETPLTLTMPANSKVYLRGTNTAFGNSNYYNKFSSRINVRCGGVISSLLTNTNEPLLDLTGHNYAYKGMFYGCTTLTTAPELPATKLANYCYESMFRECSSLTSAPELPATTLASNCYRYMFEHCSNLSSIHYGCLTTAPSSTYCSNWVSGVKSTGTFYYKSSKTWTTPSRGTSTIPSGWTLSTY